MDATVPEIKEETVPSPVAEPIAAPLTDEAAAVTTQSEEESPGDVTKVESPTDPTPAAPAPAPEPEKPATAGGGGSSDPSPPPTAPTTATEDAELLASVGELLSATGAFLAGDRNGGDGAGPLLRRNVMLAADRIKSAVRDPGSLWVEQSVQMGNLGATHLFQVWGGFEHIPDEGSISFEELGKKLDAEPMLIERIVGVMLSMKLLKLVGDDSVAHTATSRIFLNNNPVGHMYRLNWENAMDPYFNLEAYFKKYGRKEPQKQTDIPWTFARGHPEKTVWEVMCMDPDYLQRFFIGMSIIEGRSPADGIYDFGWLVEKAGQEPNRTVFIDVGGGKGHALLAIQREFPGLPLERMVLQDRPESIEKAEAEPSLAKVQKEAIDFHVEQPNKGAMVYFIRRCLHDYGDTVVTGILKVLAEALADDSHILIQEDVKSMPPDPETGTLDFLMMMYGGKERTRKCWDDVISKAGLKVVGVSFGTGPWASLAVIDCVKVQGP